MATNVRGTRQDWVAYNNPNAAQSNRSVGGSYCLVLTYDDASHAPGKTSADSDVTEVQISRIVPGEQIVQEIDFESDDPAFQGTMQMEWNLRHADEGTDIEVVARNVPAGIRARDHAEGITSSLTNLSTYLEPP